MDGQGAGGEPGGRAAAPVGAWVWLVERGGGSDRPGPAPATREWERDGGPGRPHNNLVALGAPPPPHLEG